MTTIAELNATVDRFSRRVDTIIAENAVRDAEYRAAEERRRAELQVEQAKTEKALRRMENAISRSVNMFDKNWGNLIESFVGNQILGLFVDRGILVTDGSAQNVGGKIAGKSTELDMVLVNSDIAVVIEVKSTLQRSDVKRFLYKLKNFREGFPKFVVYDTIFGGVAYLRAKPEVVEYAQENGLFTILATGDSAKMMNDVNFQPQKWGR